MTFVTKDYVLEIDKPWSPGSGASYFQHRIIGSGGVRGGVTTDEDGHCSFMIDFPGEYFTTKRVIDQWRLVKGLNEQYSVKCTRIDLAIDDPTYSEIPVDEMVQACNDGHNFGFRKIGSHSSGFCGGRQSITREFGSRNGGKMVRVYDHDGECLRFEAEFKRGYAHPTFGEFASLKQPEQMTESLWEMELQRVIASLAVGAIDFRDRGNRQDKTRAGVRDSVRLSFYQKFIDKLKAIHCKIKLNKPLKSIRKTFEWVKRQCAPSIAMICEGLGEYNFKKWMNEILEDGSNRIDNQKNIWTKEIQSNPKMYAR
jgi:hypothetical protein